MPKTQRRGSSFVWATFGSALIIAAIAGAYFTLTKDEPKTPPGLEDDPRDAEAAPPLEESPPPVPASAGLSGRVLDPKGSPLEGTEVLWSSLSTSTGRDPVPAGTPRSLRTSDDGSFHFSLSPGEYRLSTPPSPGRSAARLNVTAPSSSAILTVYPSTTRTVRGQVNDREGQAIEGAKLVASVGGETTTGNDGRYELKVTIPHAPGSILAITASRPGFREQHKSAALSPDDGDTEVEISFSLDRLRKTADLHGRVASKDGEALPDQAIYLRRGHQRHSATTNADGSYEFKGLETATNYILSVFPSQDYRDVERSPLELVPGDNRLDIELNPIEYATLSARVVGIRAIEQTLSGDKLDGDPVPALTLQIRSRAARAQRVSVTTDEEGKFRSHVPVGDLIVETRALPRITVRGLKIETGQELSAELPVGIGDHTLDGEVRSTNGRALPGVRLVATWTEKTKHLRTSLHLETKSDATGSFKFERLSPGTYSIQATGVGLKTKRVEAKVDDESKPISIEMR